jgi:acrylyl-CoA reductase (NADPH)
MFKALLIERTDDQMRARLAEVADEDLPEGDVVVDVAYSSLNYKDALAVTGTAPIARHYPMVAGIDLAGTVATSEHPAFAEGDEVVATGSGLGERHWGGMAQRARLAGDWLVPLPPGFTPAQAMEIGTAGFTAMLCVLALEDHGIGPDAGKVLVTGAGGGVGGIAIALLAARGYDVIASTGRPRESDYLRDLGAGEVIDRAELSTPGRPLASQRWAGAVDAVGGQTLANALAATRYGGVVAACGNAGGMDLPASVAPFILRGVTLVGVDSVMCPRDRRLRAWQRLGEDLDPRLLDSMSEVIGLGEVLGAAEQMLAGRLRGRRVVDVHR